MFMRWCYWSHLVLPCTNGHQNKPIFSCLCLWGGAFTRILYFRVQTGTKTNLFLVVYVYEVVLLLASCTSMYKQAPKHTYLQLFMFMRWCFWSHLVCPCTNGHQNKPIFSCLCLWGGAFTRILYFDVQTGTKTYLSLVVCVYGEVLLVAFCTSVYKHASKTNLSLVVYVWGWCFQSHFVLRCTSRNQNKPIFSCLCLWGGAFTCILYFNVQTGTKTNLFLVVYVYEVVILLASCTSMYKQAPKHTYLQLFVFTGRCFQSHFVLRCTSTHQKQTYLQLFISGGGAFSCILYFGVQAGTKNKPIFSCLCLWGGALEYISNARLQFLNPILPQRKIVSAV